MSYSREVAHLPLACKLEHLDIELTERCDNSCIHCYINMPLEHICKSMEMSDSLIKAALAQAAALGCLTVRISGGEPLLHSSFNELYLYARRLGMRVVLYTNARRLNQELIDIFLKTPPGEPIEITSYGLTKDSYDRTACKKGAYEEYIQGVELLAKNNIPFVIKHCLLPTSKDEEHSLTEWIKKATAQNKDTQPIVHFFKRARRDNPIKDKLIESLRPEPDTMVDIYMQNPNYIKETIAFIKNFCSVSGDKLFSCGFGKGACLDAYGNLQGCMLLRHPQTVYPLKQGSMDEAVNSFFSSLCELRAENPEYLKRCAKCYLKNLCGQCPAQSWMEYGTLDTPVEYLCNITHSAIRRIGLINENEYIWDIENIAERIDKMYSNIV